MENIICPVCGDGVEIKEGTPPGAIVTCEACGTDLRLKKEGQHLIGEVLKR